MERFRDRRDAGRRLAGRVAPVLEGERPVVLGLARGGVPVAYEVARALGAPLDAFLVRKLGAPGREELAMGAIATGGVRVLNDEVVRALDLSEDQIAAVAAVEQRELERRELSYREGRPPPDVRGCAAVLVDDGLATGSSMRAAAIAARVLDPARVIVAVPVASNEACEDVGAEVDEIVCAITPRPFVAVGAWYEDFSQTTDDEVADLLRQAREPAGSRG